MKKKMQINKKKEERRGTQEKMSKVEKTARPAKAEKPIKATRPANAEKPIKATRPAKAEKPIKPAERADAVCPYAKKCGGCDYQGMPYEKQLKEKQAYVQKQVGNFCKVLPILGMDEPYHYRNKVHAVFDIEKKRGSRPGARGKGQAANGKQAQRIQRFALLPAPQFWAHANGKLVYFDAAPLRGKEMAQLMDKNKRAKHHDSNEQGGDKRNCPLQELPHNFRLSPQFQF